MIRYSLDFSVIFNARLANFKITWQKIRPEFQKSGLAISRYCIKLQGSASIFQIRSWMAEEMNFENGQFGNFQGILTFTSTLNLVISHTAMHQSLISTHIPNFLGLDNKKFLRLISFAGLFSKPRDTKSRMNFKKIHFFVQEWAAICQIESWMADVINFAILFPNYIWQLQRNHDLHLDVEPSHMLKNKQNIKVNWWKLYD